MPFPRMEAPSTATLGAKPGLGGGGGGPAQGEKGTSMAELEAVSEQMG